MMGRILRLAVTALLVAFILTRVDLADLWEHLRGLDGRLLLVGYLLNLGMVALNAWRWQLLVRAQGTRVGLLRLVSYYFVCMFFNTFTPTSIGGDVARVIDLARHTGRRASAFASILVERVVGLLVLLPVSLVGLAACYPGIITGHRILVYLEAVLVAVLLAAFVVIRLRNAPELLARFPLVGRFAGKPGVRRRVENAQSAIDVYRGRGALLAGVFAISVASRVVWILSCYIFGSALAIPAPLSAYFLVIPLVEVARTVPISLSGIGIREGAIVALFSFFGVEASAALGLSIVIYAPFLLNGLIGGLLYAARSREGRIKVAQEAQ